MPSDLTEISEAIAGKITEIEERAFAAGAGDAAQDLARKIGKLMSTLDAGRVRYSPTSLSFN